MKQVHTHTQTHTLSNPRSAPKCVSVCACQCVCVCVSVCLSKVLVLDLCEALLSSSSSPPLPLPFILSDRLLFTSDPSWRPPGWTLPWKQRHTHTHTRTHARTHTHSDSDVQLRRLLLDLTSDPVWAGSVAHRTRVSAVGQSRRRTK